MFDWKLNNLLAGLLSIALFGIVAATNAVGEEAEEGASASEPLTVEEEVEKLRKVFEAPPAEDGADSCLKCHDEYNEYPVMPLFRTRHASVVDPRSPFANQQCESCHGPGGKHEERTRGDEKKAPIINFGKDAWTPVADQNAQCLNCHQTHHRVDWQGSAHEFNEVACASCHTIHVAKDPVMDRHGQAGVCYTCHAKQRAEFFQISRHPVREGLMACSDCHDVHGDGGGGMKVAANNREMCTSCHAEKRGPFLWEHAPAAEDCTLCHSTHGSHFPALLKKRPPHLCQQCHAQAGHPSVSYNGSTIPGPFLSVKGCLNCHAKVHGTNHPSGVSPLR